MTARSFDLRNALVWEASLGLLTRRERRALDAAIADQAVDAADMVGSGRGVWGVALARTACVVAAAAARLPGERARYLAMAGQ